MAVANLASMPATNTWTRDSPPHSRADRWVSWTLALVLVGLLWRLSRYLLQFPIWGDEAFICLNLHEQTYLGLSAPLRHNQVAPLLYLWGELTALHWLGDSELSLRLQAMLAGSGALVLFWRLASWTLPRPCATLAVGLLAVAYYPVRHACEVKPYANDLLASVALLTAAVWWLRAPQHTARLLLLTLLLPLVLGESFPAVFVAGGISLALLPVIWQRRRSSIALFLSFGLYNVVLLVSFLGYYQLQAPAQGEPQAAALAELRDYWQQAFPPDNPLAWPGWLLQVHTGNLFAYPVGGPRGGSAGTFLLFLLGLVTLWRGGQQRQLLFLLLAPFALTLAAAALHRYPYGGSARVAQHLAPAICLLTAVGIVTVIRAWTTESGGAKWVVGLQSALLLFGAVGVVRDLVQPQKTTATAISHDLALRIVEQAGPSAPIVLRNDFISHSAELHWYLLRGHPRLIPAGGANWPELAERFGRMITVGLTPQPPTPATVPTEVKPHWHLVSENVTTLPRTREVGGTQHVQVAEWRRNH